MADIRGIIKLNKLSTWSSNTLYAACFLKERVIFVKIGGQFAESGSAMAGVMLGGIIGGMIGSGLDKKNKNIKSDLAQKLMELSPDELLYLDKKNFSLANEEIENITVKPSTFSIKGNLNRSGLVKITSVGKKAEEYDLPSSEDYQQCCSVLLDVMPGKVTVEGKK